MAFVLVHSPLIGPCSWGPVAVELRRLGHEVRVPDLRTRYPVESYWLHQVTAVVAAVGDTASVTLVAHSGSGPLLPAIGAEVHGQVERYVFVDAGLPHPGQSRLGALPAPFAERLRRMVVEGSLPPWYEWFETGTLERLLPDPIQRALLVAETAPLPLRMFQEPLPQVIAWSDAPCTYIRLSAAYDQEAATAASLGWSVISLDANHLSIMTDPDGVVMVLTDSA